MIWILFSCAVEQAEEVCDEAPLATYESFGKGFIQENCQGCHASTTQNRNGAPQDVIFDSHEDVILNAELILETVTTEDPTMPPEGGVNIEEREMVETWLSCWEVE